MKKNIGLYTLVFLLILMFSVTTNAVELKDVPRDHWAYQSVKTLVEKGYLSLYEDGTFSGNNKVTRYELAELVARILDNIQGGKSKPTEQDVDTLRKLSLEFRDELVDIAKKQEIFSQEIKKQKQTNIIQNEEIGKVNEKLTTVEEDISRIIDNILQIKKMDKRINLLEQEINTLEKDIKQTNQRLKEKEVNINSLKKQLNDSILKDIEDQNAITQTKIHSLQRRVNELEDEISSYQTQQVSKKNDKKEENAGVILGAIALLALVAGS